MFSYFLEPALSTVKLALCDSTLYDVQNCEIKVLVMMYEDALSGREN